MTEHDRQPGGFSDESGVPIAHVTDTFAEEFQRARETKQRIIAQALTDGEITQEYADLLLAIESRTMNGDVANLKKVEAALDLRAELQGTFQDGTVAYMGSGHDWEFAVALGARNIDMVDEMFVDGEKRGALFDVVKRVDPEAELVQGEVPVVRFGMNLGHGVEQVQLRLFGTDVMQYAPRESLAGVIEIAGPTKGLAPKQPVLPNVRERLAPGANVVNFDYMSSRDEPTVPPGFRAKAVGKFEVLAAA